MTEAATDARTAPVAVWQVLEKMTKEEREAWRVAPLANRPAPEQRNLDIGFPFGWYPFMLAKDLAVGEENLLVWLGFEEQGDVMDKIQ